MLERLERLCGLSGASGDENGVRDYIISQISGFADITIDKTGNIIAFKKGRRTAPRKVMLDAHMDEVGLIITGITDNGFLRFETVGGIDTSVLLARHVTINDRINGVIGCKPVHLTDKKQAEKLPDKESLYIDIGAADMAEAKKCVSAGDYAVFDSEFVKTGNVIKAKAIDDRAGCAILIELLQCESEFDFTAVFSVQEEVGCRGARVAAFSVDPDIAFILEATTAADICGVSPDKRVCVLGDGPAVSFMDKSTVYDRALYNHAISCGVKCQPKSAVAGGNNSGAVHLSRDGVRTMAISVPCRYIHSPSCMADITDIEGAVLLAKHMLNAVCTDLKL